MKLLKSEDLIATFYEGRIRVAKEMDALVTSTRFGPGHRHLDDLVYDPVLDEDVWLLGCESDGLFRSPRLHQGHS